MKRILPTILAFITQQDRYFPEIEWSSNSWTHNIFRFYELIFGRRVGIRVEMSSILKEGKVFYACHSFESFFALTEQYVREFFTSLKWKPFKIYIPVLQTPQGIPVFTSPYLFAIAFNAGSFIFENSGSYVASVSTNHTCTGSNLVLLSSAMVIDTDSVSTITYNSVGSTYVIKKNYSITRWCYIYAQSNPSTGTNTHTVNYSPNSRYCELEGISISGAKQSVTANVTGSASGIGTNMTTAVTTTVDNCMGFLSFHNAGDAMTPGTNCTVNAANNSFGYSAIKTPAGSLSMTATVNSSQYWGTAMAAFEPYVAPSGPANLKSRSGNLKANIKSASGNLIANMKSLSGNS